jgi:hypothetical protein
LPEASGILARWTRKSDKNFLHPSTVLEISVSKVVTTGYAQLPQKNRKERLIAAKERKERNSPGYFEPHL